MAVVAAYYQFHFGILLLRYGQDLHHTGRVQTVLNAIRLYAASVFRALAAQDVAEIHFPVAAYEL